MNNKLIPRTEYINRLIEFKDKPVIKVIVGVRRCGKSTLLQMYRSYLLSTGIAEEDIIMMNFVHRQFSNITANQVSSIISNRSRRTYVLFDEIQMLESWDSMVLDLFENTDCDICITGSNSTMFSSNISTLLSGRAVTIEMLPFSYNEFLEFTHKTDSDDTLTEYLTYGGFPLALMVRESESAETAVLEDIYSTVILKDIALRYNLRNQQMLDRISRFLMRNIGNLVSVKSICDFMSSNGSKINFETADSYLGYLVESFAFYRVKRYSIKAKEEMTVNDKFYVSDLGLRTSVLGHRNANIGHLMENAVYLELRRRGFKVYVGYNGESEIDFIAMDSHTKCYFQVCYSMRDPETEEREIRPLKRIKDSYRKAVIVMERSINTDRDGIEEILLRDFLSGKTL